MKKLLLMMAIIIAPFALTSCGDDKDDNYDFNYPLETLYGTWQVTHFKADAPDDYIEWLDEKTTATFYKNGKYYGEGAFGTGNGTYTAIGNRITTYVDGEVYYMYDVISLSGNTAELILSTTKLKPYCYIKCTKIK